MGSTRLPGKVMADLAGEPMLVRCINRTLRAQVLDEVVVATTIKPSDDAIVGLCAERHWPCFRGSEEDVLDRYYRAAVAYEADVVVRITSDCPLIDPEIINKVAGEFLRLQSEVDYACNILPQGTFPRGLDVEVLSFDVLKEIWRRDENPAWREHVTLYLLQHPDLFQIHYVVLDLPHIRWTVDTQEDLALVQKIFNYFGHDRFSCQEVLCVLEQNRHWLDLNRHVSQKEIPVYGTR